MIKQLNFESSGAPIIDSVFVVIDCETTGLSPSENAITEIAAIKISAGQVLGTFHSLINPEQQLPSRIAKLTGLNNEQLKKCPKIEQVIPSLLEFVGNEILVGHNIKFDLGFINASLQRCNYEPLDNRFLDTLSLAKKIIPNEVRDFKLSTLAAYCKSTISPTHRAFSDVEATIEVFHYLIERSSAIGVTGINDLFTLPGIQKRSRFLKKQIASDAPRNPGVYMFISKDDEILYVGKSVNIRQRLSSYFLSDDRSRISRMLKNAVKIEYLITPTDFEARIAELRLLQEIKPEFNVADTNNSRMYYVSLNKDENIPTFRVQIGMKDIFSPNMLSYGPFTSRKSAEEFREAAIYLFGLRNCSNKCVLGKQTATSSCINSIRNIHSCFCNNSWDSFDEYSNKVKLLNESFNWDFEKYSKELIAEMKFHSDNLQFEKAKILRDYAFCVQKWMNRFSTISRSSQSEIIENVQTPRIVFGRPIVRWKSSGSSDSLAFATKIVVEQNEQIKNTIDLGFNKDENYFVSNANEFRERFYTANFLAKKNLLTTALNKNKHATEATDHKRIKVNTIL